MLALYRKNNKEFVETVKGVLYSGKFAYINDKTILANDVLAGTNNKSEIDYWYPNATYIQNAH